MWGEVDLLLGVVGDFALRQRFLQFGNLCLGEVGVALKAQRELD
jgi:hypothetical protein